MITCIQKTSTIGSRHRAGVCGIIRVDTQERST
jgi:hypothetical protein